MEIMSFVSFSYMTVILSLFFFNAFKKKTQKTPDSEIKKAVKLKEEYYATKGNQ